MLSSAVCIIQHQIHHYTTLYNVINFALENNNIRLLFLSYFFTDNIVILLFYVSMLVQHYHQHSTPPLPPSMLVSAYILSVVFMPQSMLVSANYAR
jgi:hypothetical protein